MEAVTRKLNVSTLMEVSGKIFYPGTLYALFVIVYALYFPKILNDNDNLAIIVLGYSLQIFHINTL